MTVLQKHTYNRKKNKYCIVMQFIMCVFFDSIKNHKLENLNDVKSCNKIKDFLTVINAYYSKGASVKYALHSLLDGKIMNIVSSESLD